MPQPAENRPGPEPLLVTRRLAEAALDRKAENVVAIDARGLTSFADFFVLATGSSDRHVRAVSDAVLETARALGENVLGKEGYDEGRWVLIDLGDVIVNVFRGELREHFDLDRLWEEAPRIALETKEAERRV